MPTLWEVCEAWRQEMQAIQALNWELRDWLSEQGADEPDADDESEDPATDGNIPKDPALRARTLPQRSHNSRSR